MDGKTPMEKLRELGFDLLDEFATFPVVLLDEVVVIWTSKGGHNVLAYYIGGARPGGGARRQPSQAGPDDGRNTRSNATWLAVI